MSVFLADLLTFFQTYGYPALWVSVFIAAVGAPLANRAGFTRGRRIRGAWRFQYFLACPYHYQCLGRRR